MEKATFPELTDMPDELKQSWFQNYVRKITLEDPKHIYNLEKAEYMPILLQSLAARVGNLINDADLSRDTGLTSVNARAYRNILNGTFITNYLHPWYRNISKRLVKSGKIYFYDTMLLSYILKSTPEEIHKSNLKLFGHLLENFVLSELIKLNNTQLKPVEISFYKTRDGKEVDFILENGASIVGIEVKNFEKITEKEVAGLRELKEVTGKDFICGVILCNTERVINYDEDIYLIPLSALWLS
ncbi:MAG: ATP-binding protein [bacterium]